LYSNNSAITWPRSPYWFVCIMKW